MTTPASSALKTILVHLDESPHCAVRTALAAQLAVAYDSHLIGLAPTAGSSLSIPVRLVPFSGSADFVNQSAMYVEKRVKALVEEFETRVQTVGLMSFEGRIADGESIDTVSMYGRVADLIVVGQYDPEAQTPVGRDFAEQVMLQSGPPVLMVPYAGHFEGVDRHALVAWRNTREASVALRNALPFLRRTAQVTLMQVLSLDESPSPSDLPMIEVARWLSRHGVKAEIYETRSEIAAGNVLLSRASDIGADLIVMGGYGHTRWREMVMGGVTRQLLEQMTVPVLMSH